MAIMLEFVGTDADRAADAESALAEKIVELREARAEIDRLRERAAIGLPSDHERALRYAGMIGRLQAELRWAEILAAELHHEPSGYDLQSWRDSLAAVDAMFGVSR